MSGSESRRLDHRGPTLALVVWAGTWLCTLGRGDVWLLCAGAGSAAVLWGWRVRRRLLVAAGVLLLGCLVTAGARSAIVHAGPLPGLAAERAVVEVEAVLGPGRLSTQGRFGAYWWADASVEAVAGRAQAWQLGARVRIIASGEAATVWNEVVPGTRVRATLRLEAAEPGDAVAAVGRAREPPEATGEPAWYDAAVHHVRAGLREASAVLAPEPRALVPALVVGDTSGMDADLQERFRTTGLTHLTAVSGSNLAILLASLLWFGRRAGLRGWWLRGTAVVAVAWFVALCHGEPSVVRAAAMGSVGLAALGWGGREQGLRFLSWAVVLLLLADPWLSSSAGFALSVVATAGIIAFARSWTAALAAWLPRGIAEAIAVPLAAQLATQPIVSALSGQLSLVGIVANLLAGPLVGPTTVLGFACAAVAWLLPGPAQLLAWLAGWGAQGLCWIAALGAALPAAAIPWPSGPVGVVLLIGLGLAGYLLLGRVLRRRWLVVAAAVLLVVVISRPWSVPGWPPSGWQVVQCDVGQGTATVVAVGPGEGIVVDTGTETPLLERCLAGLGVTRVPLLVVTHFHADHVGGVAALAGRDVQVVLLSDVVTPADGRAAVLAATPSAQHLTAANGMVLTVGQTRVEVVSVLALSGVTGEVAAESSAENDASVVVRVQTPAITVLATGDIEHAGQEAVLRSGAEVRADVLVVPHHGSADQSPELLAAVAAPIALIGVGKDNDYGHPAPTALRLLAAAGTLVYRTDTQGAIAVVRTEAGLQVATERTE